MKGSGNVVLTQGEKQSLIIKTDDNIMPLIETDVSGKKLTISHGKHHLRPTRFEVYITVKKLEGVAISGSGDISGELSTDVCTLSVISHRFDAGR